MGTDGSADPLSDDQVAAAVAAARPGWRLVEAAPVEAGTNVVYRVTVEDGDGRRRALLKCYRPPPTAAFTSPRRFLAGAEIQETVRRESSLPVPAVLGVRASHPDVPAPLVLSERFEGTDARRAGLLDERERLERFARDAGRHLARTHDVCEFDRFGRLRPADGTLVVGDGHGSWAGHARAVARADLDRLHETRFADLESRLRDGLESLLASVEVDPTPVLTHGDYAPDNLLVDPATGELTGVVDWELATADDRVHEIATAEVPLGVGAGGFAPTTAGPGRSPFGVRRRIGLADVVLRGGRPPQGLGAPRVGEGDALVRRVARRRADGRTRAVRRRAPSGRLGRPRGLTPDTGRSLRSRPANRGRYAPWRYY